MADGPRIISTRSTSARPIVHDFAILGGAVLTNALFDRLIRPHFNQFMIGLFRNVYPRLVRARHRTVYLYFSTLEAANVADRYIRDRTTDLIQGLTLRVYPFVYNRIEWVYVWIRDRRAAIGNGHVENGGGGVQQPPRRTRLDRHLERASFRYIPDIDEGELDDVNEDGLIEAYERSESTSGTEDEPEDLETETEVEESEAVSSGLSRWGTSNVTSFDPSKKKGRCSTPVKLTFPKETTEDTSQLQQSEAKVAALEVQLNEMKAMIALILENQNKTIMSDNNKTVAPALVPVTSAPAPGLPPPPPPPPPPPMPSLQLCDANTQAQIRLRVGRKSGSGNPGNVDGPDKLTKAEPEVKSMADVLKGLSGVKLRPTERSPGGTPLKRPKRFSANDPNSVLEQVLMRRFARMHSPSDNEQDDDNRRRSSSNKENDDSFDNSPKPLAAVQFKGFPARRSSLAPPVEGGDADLRTTAIPEENESSLDENTSKAPNSQKFGQHLLKPLNANGAKKNLSAVLRQSNSKSPLREQFQNANYM